MIKNAKTRQSVANIESVLVANQVKLGSLLARAEISPSMWSQYKLGHRSPTLETWAKAERALDSIMEDIKDAG